MAGILETVFLAVDIFNMCIHIFGSYLLICAYKYGDDKIQQILLINISITASLGNALGVLTSGVIDMEKVQHYFWTINVTGVYMLYYLAMVYVTINRMLETLFQLNYPLYITEKSVKFLVGGTWLGCSIISIICSLVNLTGLPIFRLHMVDSYSRYIYLGLDIIFVVIVTITFILIYRNVFLDSSLFVYVLLFTCYMIFVAVPNLVHVAMHRLVDIEHKHHTLLLFIIITFRINYFSDALIYIIFNKSVWKLLKKKLGCHNERDLLMEQHLTRRHSMEKILTVHDAKKEATPEIALTNLV